MKKLVLLSGGLDSTLAFLKAFKANEEVEGIFFSYGQKNFEEELHSVKKLEAITKCKVAYIELPFMASITSSPLLESNTGSMNEESYVKGVPNSFVPNRNQIFLTIAHSYAIKVGAEEIVTGMFEHSPTACPDNNPVFLDKLEEVTALGSKKHIKFVDPLRGLKKEEVFRQFDELGFLTHAVMETATCYNGSTFRNYWGKGCGECPSCLARKEAYNKF